MMLVQPKVVRLPVEQKAETPVVRVELPPMPEWPPFPEWPEMPKQAQAKPPSYRFQIIRDEFGQIVEMIATPI